MPSYNPTRIEYPTVTGHIAVVQDNGESLPAYWAHPAAGRRFPSLALVHHWWGLNDSLRRLANLFAQIGYYVIVPDLFSGVQPKSPMEAMPLMERLGDQAYGCVDAALSVLERHHHTTGDVAAIGFGLGADLALEAAAKRPDVEAVVAFYPLAANAVKSLARGQTPVLGIFGTQDGVASEEHAQALEAVLRATPLRERHRVLRVPGAAHDFMTTATTPEQRDHVRQGWEAMIGFLDSNLSGPTRAANGEPPKRRPRRT